MPNEICHEAVVASSIGTLLTVDFVFLVVQTLTLIYVIVMLKTKADMQDMNPELRWLSLIYHISAFALLLNEFTHHAWGAAQWAIRYNWYCHLIYFLFGFNLLVVYGINILFWLYRLCNVATHAKKKYFFCLNSIIILWKQKKEQKKQKTAIVFQGTSLRIAKSVFGCILGSLGLTVLLVLCVSIWLGVSSDCVVPGVSSDFEVKWLFSKAKDNVYYFCHQQPVASIMLTVVGTILACGLNGVIAYMYVSRILETVKMVQTSMQVECLRPTTVVIKEQEMEEGGKKKNHENAKTKSGVCVEAEPLLAHACKAGIIAFTSILSTIISFTLASSTKYEQFLAADTIFNGFLICCSFTFGQKFFDCMFGNCSARLFQYLTLLVVTNP
ncbi:hypothetical protein RFI_16442 [Reticulomyxa filosa]|uniref:Uncharacterized protein n=1 Tax=Reticulomyxa filosa TaxID=46433 RepID=X6N3C1_RETFI|nr:hypothetical protein RFI_16442 [Reticulomyxa filosa]|eukprot:ETO20780.1 hypothetical protein RFI_16442 [Reticulomyxa filosa]